MVKADPKRDYYADLDLPATADSDTIKKRFRELARQYHPDRNPGREVDVLSKFQDVQAAHEILSDPAQKAKYDNDRAKLNRPVADSPGFKRPPPPRPAATFNVPNPSAPPPPRRDPSANRAYQGRPQPPKPASSQGADKFAQFARPQPQQQWDRARFEDSQAEALRNIHAMRGGSAQGQHQQQQQQPPRQPPRHPTAPKAGAPSSGPYSAGAGPSPGFPGLGRTPSQRRFAASGPGVDEPGGTSAYAHVHRNDRPPSAGPYQNSGFESPNNVRPGLTRASSRYAGHSGERTAINTGNLHRSASMRSSPVDSKYDDKVPFGSSRPQTQSTEARPRHRSLSPKMRPAQPAFTTSADETSSDEATAERNKPKAVPRQTRGPFMANRTLSGDEPALTGQFPNTNYTRVVDDSTYQYPPPESRGHPSRRPFSNMTSPIDNFATLNMNGNGSRPSTQDNKSEQATGGGAQETAGQSRVRNTFSANDWHDKFKAQEDIFTPPPQPNSRDRRSPTRSSRSGRAGNRAQGPSRSDDSLTNNVDDSTTNGPRFVDPEDAQSKAGAFQPGKFSAEDWAERLRSQSEVNLKNAKTHQRGSKSNSYIPKSNDDVLDRGKGFESAQATNGVKTPDAEADMMDIDEPAEDGVSPRTSQNGNKQETTNTNGDSRPTTATDTEGIDLNDLSQQAPFAPSASGIKNMSDLGTNLPFDSQPSKDFSLNRTKSQLFRDLQLPHPPKPIQPPTSNITQSSWEQYADGMRGYMHDWNSFNNKMIEHFRTRQEQVSHNMYKNWVSAQGDGVSADAFDAHHGHDKAGYATYMQWLSDDRICRAWWDAAYEEHWKCLEGLGRTRNTVKAMRNQTA